MLGEPRPLLDGIGMPWLRFLWGKEIIQTQQREAALGWSSVGTGSALEGFPSEVNRVSWPSE